jgi:membrane associated rhomboid family serine protease
MLFPIGDDNVERGHLPLVSYAFLLLNVLVFSYQAYLPTPESDAFVHQYGAVPAFISTGSGLLTLFTSIFLHGSWIHLIGNMLFLWIFADNIEATIGNIRFLFFYVVGGIVAGLAQVAIDPLSQIPCVGASGAIAAVLGAYILMFPRSRIRIWVLFFVFYVHAWVFLGLWFAQQLVSGLGIFGLQGDQMGNVAWWAHIGGFAYGLLRGISFRKYVIKPDIAQGGPWDAPGY